MKNGAKVLIVNMLLAIGLVATLYGLGATLPCEGFLCLKAFLIIYITGICFLLLFSIGNGLYHRQKQSTPGLVFALFWLLLFLLSAFYILMVLWGS